MSYSLSGIVPDAVWIKNRSDTTDHFLANTVIGAGYFLYPNLTNAENYDILYKLKAFNSDGFDLGGNGQVNSSSNSYVAYSWDAGSSTVSNTDGSITTSVRANQTAGFSIVSYTGTGANATIGHGLNAAPEFAIFKARNGSNHWLVYHKSIGSSKKVNLNLSDAASSSSTFFQNTDPTSSVMYLGTESSGNWSGYNMIAYCFAPVAGYSAFGSYTGNGSSDGTFVYTGFKVRWLMIKRNTSGYNWQIHDTARIAHNVNTKALFANGPDSEYTFSSAVFDLLSNGFKARGGDNYTNASGATYLYIALAENPFSSNGGLAR